MATCNHANRFVSCKAGTKDIAATYIQYTTKFWKSPELIEKEENDH